MDKEEFEWAILFLPSSAASKEPFVAAPIVPDTYLSAQALMAAQEAEDENNRFVVRTESVAYNLTIAYSVYMYVHASFFRSIFGMVEVLNGYYRYCMTEIDPDMAVTTGYALCTAVFPFTTKKDLALHALLAASEIKAITKFPGHVWEVQALRFEPNELPEEPVIK